MRLIDADELEKVKFHPLPYTHITPTDVNAEAYKRGWNDAIDAIMSEADTIEERKKGKWIYKSELGWGETWLCSECGEKTTSTIMGKPRYNWCPMCGADMRGDSDG